MSALPLETEVTFQSDRFRPVLPEESQVNPGRYGAELAYWLCVKLMEAGVVTSYPNFEDWGWFLEYITEEGDEYWLCCGNIDGSNNTWLCYLEAKAQGFFGSRKPSLARAKPLLTGLRQVLEAEESIRDVRWCAKN